MGIWVSDKVRLKPVSSARKMKFRLLQVYIGYFPKSNGWAGWSAPLLFAHLEIFLALRPISLVEY